MPQTDLTPFDDGFYPPWLQYGGSGTGVGGLEGEILPPSAGALPGASQPDLSVLGFTRPQIAGMPSRPPALGGVPWFPSRSAGQVEGALNAPPTLSDFWNYILGRGQPPVTFKPGQPIQLPGAAEPSPVGATSSPAGPWNWPLGGASTPPPPVSPPMPGATVRGPLAVNPNMPGNGGFPPEGPPGPEWRNMPQLRGTDLPPDWRNMPAASGAPASPRPQGSPSQTPRPPQRPQTPAPRPAQPTPVNLGYYSPLSGNARGAQWQAFPSMSDPRIYRGPLAS